MRLNLARAPRTFARDFVPALLLALALGACDSEPLLPIDQTPLGRADDIDDAANDGVADGVDDGVDDGLDDEDEVDVEVNVDNENVPDFVACANVPHLLDTGFVYGAAELPSGEVALASSAGTWLFNADTGDARVLHDAHAWRVTVADDQLFALASDESILAFGNPSAAGVAAPLEIAFGEGHVIDLDASGDRLFFTEEAPGRLRSVTFTGGDPREHLGAEIAHEISVDDDDDATYVAGWIDDGSSATIARAGVDGSVARFFDAFDNPLEDDAPLQSGERINFSSALALTQDETHVYFSTSIAPGGIARVSKQTRAWSVLQRLPSSFATELFVHDGWLYFSENEVSISAAGGFTGRLLRTPVAGGAVERVLDCGPSLRILGPAAGFLYLSMDANGAAPYLTRIVLD